MLITLCGKIVDSNKIYAEIEDVQKMGNVIIETFQELAVKHREEEIAKKLLQMGMDALDVIEVTGISIERIREIRESIRNDAVIA